jgi:hypothetical protein
MSPHIAGGSRGLRPRRGLSLRPLRARLCLFDGPSARCRYRVPSEVRVVAHIVGVAALIASGRVTVSGPAVHCCGDPLRCRQIVRNLVSNADRYGGESIRIVVSASANRATVFVLDNGSSLTRDKWDSRTRTHSTPTPNTKRDIELRSPRIAWLWLADLIHSGSADLIQTQDAGRRLGRHRLTSGSHIRLRDPPTR